MDRWRRHVDAQPHPPHAALAFDARAEAGGVRQVDALQRPTEDEVTGCGRGQVETGGGNIYRLRVLLLQVGELEARHPRPESGWLLAGRSVGGSEVPAVQGAVQAQINGGGIHVRRVWPRNDQDPSLVQRQLDLAVTEDHAGTSLGSDAIVSDRTQTRFAPESASRGSWIRVVPCRRSVPTTPTGNR